LNERKRYSVTKKLSESAATARLVFAKPTSFSRSTMTFTNGGIGSFMQEL